MDESQIVLVSLHRCKKCGVRMFAIDRCGHMLRHGIDVSEEQLENHFTVGKKKNIPARVGGNYLPLRKPKTRQKRIKKRKKS